MVGNKCNRVKGHGMIYRNDRRHYKVNLLHELLVKRKTKSNQ